VTTYVYDAEGRLAYLLPAPAGALVAASVYDAAGRLAAPAGALVTTSVYDAAGGRLAPAPDDAGVHPG
jgi:hypothetical protein